jgi:hypothetical protein
MFYVYIQDPSTDSPSYKGKIKEGFRNLEICQRNEQSWGKCRQIKVKLPEVTGEGVRSERGIWYDE